MDLDRPDLAPGEVRRIVEAAGADRLLDPPPHNGREMNPGRDVQPVDNDVAGGGAPYQWAAGSEAGRRRQRRRRRPAAILPELPTSAASYPPSCSAWARTPRL